MEVKKLVWENNVAETPIGKYIVCGEIKFSVYLGTPDNNINHGFKLETVGRAKKFAQEHFAETIMKCLE